jgi:hypothetical protein
MSDSQPDTGVRREDNIEVRVIMQRDEDGVYYQANVSLINGVRTVKILNCRLNATNIRQLRGATDGGISTSARVFGMLEDACRDYPRAPLPEDEQ